MPKPTIVKVVLIGDEGVGKTALVQKYTSGKVPEEYKPTVGVNFMIKELPGDVKLQIWDTAGQERFTSLGEILFRDANAFVFVVDLTNPNSAQALRDNWVKKTNEYSDVPKILVATKSDHVQKVDITILTTLARDLNLDFNGGTNITCAVADDENVNKFFQHVVELVQAKAALQHTATPVIEEKQSKNPKICCWWPWFQSSQKKSDEKADLKNLLDEDELELVNAGAGDRRTVKLSYAP